MALNNHMECGSGEVIWKSGLKLPESPKTVRDQSINSGTVNEAGKKNTHERFGRFHC